MSSEQLNIIDSERFHISFRLRRSHRQPRLFKIMVCFLPERVLHCLDFMDQLRGKEILKWNCR